MRYLAVSLAAGITASMGISIATSGAAWSQQSRTASVNKKSLQQTLSEQVQVGSTREKYAESLRQSFAMVDADSDGVITQRDVDLHKTVEDAQRRAQSVVQVMRYDLDGDGFVTEPEIRNALAYELRSYANKPTTPGGANPRPAFQDALAGQIASRLQNLMVLDADHDGKISAFEAAQSDKSFRGGMFVRAQQFLELDVAAGGSVSLAAFEAAGAELFRQIDADGDGVVSQQEMIDFRARAERLGCEMPKASEQARVILFSSYETETLSTVTLGSQDNIVHAGRIDIEPGADPLYIVATSYAPTIWQFTGAVDRIEQAVVTSFPTDKNRGERDQRPLVGVVGLPKERVTFFGRQNCLPQFSEAPSAASFQTVGSIRTAAGKAPDVTSATYEAGTFTAPSGAIRSVRKDKNAEPIGPVNKIVAAAPDSEAKRELFRFSPGGIVDIDPQRVVGSAPAQTYEVMPQQAGLVQLLGSGSLVRAKGGEYIIKQKMRFPAGLNGAHAVTFLLPSGVPYPNGDSGHSCVVAEETGLKTGNGCR